MVSLSVTAPVAGQVTVNSITNTIDFTADDIVSCSITAPGFIAVLDSNYLQWWESGGSVGGGQSQLAGTRVFDIAAGAVATYALVCDYTGANSSTGLYNSVLTAIFTPAP